MALNKQQKAGIEAVISSCLRNKFKNYKPESNHMPFHHALLGKDRMALFSFIQSLNTTFGTSIFEPVAVTLAQNHFSFAKSQHAVGGQISEGAQTEIQEIMNDLSTGKTNPDKLAEVERIRKVCQDGKLKDLKPVKVDLYIEETNGTIHLFDLKTAKPNVSGFKDYKRTLLEWIAIILAQKPTAQIFSYIAIPYNPYEPKPYERWTMKGVLDLPNELKVASEFWDFLSADEVYSDLLACFQNVGLNLRAEIDNYFEKFKR